jgi:hydrogenase nickel incorporation protein HypA/HybF
MHEYHAVERLVRQAVEAARKNKAARITGVTVVVGKDSGIDPEIVRVHFPQAAAGTIAASATLAVKSRDTGGLFIEDIEVEA